MPQIENGTYRSIHGTTHEVIGVARHIETGESLVLHWSEEQDLIATPYTVFMSRSPNGVALYSLVPDTELINQVTFPECEHSSLLVHDAV